MKLRLLILALAFGFTINAMAQKKVNLKFQPPAGTSIDYSLNMNMETTTMGMTMPMEMAMKMETNVDQSSAEEVAVVSKIAAVKMAMDVMGQKMGYDSSMPDSTNAESQQLAAVLGNMIGKSFTSFFTPNGKVSKVEGMDDLVPAGSNMDLSQTTQQSFAFFPDYPVAVGDSWQSQDTSANNGISMLLKHNWKLAALENGKATINVETDIEALGNNVVQISKLEGKQNGSLIVEADTGITLKTDMVQDIKMEMNAGGQTSEVAVKSKIVMTGDKK